MSELIRKQTILNMLDDMQFERYHTHAELELMSRIWLAVNAIPSAQKKGHWIDTNPEEPLDPRQTCSECGNTEILHSAKFCPNCGADMREER